VLTGAEPFAHDGASEIGVLLCHGFTSTPQSMRPWGAKLAAEGLTVRCPRLPGHGTSWQECNRTGWEDWYGCLSGTLDELRERCQAVFVFGLSMGGTLALRLAEERGDDIAGLVLVNPSVTTLRKDAKLLPVLSRLVPAMPPIANDIAKPGEKELAYGKLPVRAAASLARLWKVVRADLGKVRAPVLLLRSAVDHIVEPVNARIVADGVGSADVTEIVLPDSFHVATLDHDAPMIFQLSVEFARRVQRELAEKPV
jgi:carboxylesterase